MVRRRMIAGGVGVVLLIVIVLLIGACKSSAKQQSLKDYNHEVSQLAQESVTEVSKPLFAALTNATGKSALDVEQQVDELLKDSQTIYSHAKGLSVPSEMTSAQRAVLLTFGLRVEGMSKLSAQLGSALGGQAKQASAKIAGDMEIFLASDVVYSQRAVPLIQQTLAANGIHEQSTAPSNFVPNVGWLEPTTVLSRLTGQAAGSSQNGIAPGTHGSALISVAVGTNTLAPEPTLNHISGGGNPTFTVTFEDSGSNPETDVKVALTVTAGGKQYKASRVVNSIQPGTKVNTEIPVAGVPVGEASKVEVYVEPVPGETDTENNKNTYLAIFGE
jgi:hypothetical protein